jgi:hypothetical protein
LPGAAGGVGPRGLTGAQGPQGDPGRDGIMTGFVEQAVCEFYDPDLKHTYLLWGACTEQEREGINHVILRGEK